jgi:hypothetical protein
MFFQKILYGRFAAGSRFMKNEDSDYLGPETDKVLAELLREFEDEKAAYRARQAKSKSYCLKMGDTGLEPVTPCV